MKISRLLAGLLCLTMTGIAAPAHAQNLTSEQCVGTMYDSLFKERLFYRSVLFGEKKASDLPRGAVRYDGAIQPWIKTADNEWKSYAPGAEDASHDDAQMDKNAYPPKRRGLLETREATTSELLPSILQAVRALQCRLRTVCEVAVQSRSAETPQSFTVHVDGCIDVKAQRMNACRDQGTASGTTLDLSQGNVQVGVCEQASRDILAQEQNILQLTMSYDAAYRSFLQFAGVIQGFSEALRVPVLDVLASTVQSLQKFSAVPCFSAQCDD